MNILKKFLTVILSSMCNPKLLEKVVFSILGLNVLHIF